MMDFFFLYIARVFDWMDSLPVFLPSHAHYARALIVCAWSLPQGTLLKLQQVAQEWLRKCRQNVQFHLCLQQFVLLNKARKERQMNTGCVLKVLHS